MSTPSPASASTLNDQSDKGAKKSKIVTLKFPPAQLSKFAPPKKEPPARKNSTKAKAKDNTSSASTPAMAAPSASSGDNASESNSTPVPPASLPPPPPVETKRRGIPGPKPGTKRGIAQVADGPPKPRGKPGPKKKPRLEDGTIDPAHRTTAAPTGHKLGPKANQGAINAGLRALDRSGKPCRKWERRAFQVKSFTGVVWQLPTWRTPKKQDPSENTDTTLAAADSDSKANDSSNAVKSEKSNSGDSELAVAGNGVSSPAPATPVIAAEG